MTTVVVGPDLVALRELQARAFEAVARRSAQHQATGPATTSGNRSRPVLRQIAMATALLGEAARQAASAAAAAPVPWTWAVETADAISTTALALRMLAELELAAIPGP